MRLLQQSGKPQRTASSARDGASALRRPSCGGSWGSPSAPRRRGGSRPRAPRAFIASGATASLQPPCGDSSYSMAAPRRRTRGGATTRRRTDQGRRHHGASASSMSHTQRRGRIRGGAPTAPLPPPCPTSRAGGTAMGGKGKVPAKFPEKAPAKVEEKVPARVSHHAVLKGEHYLTVVEYIKRNPAALITHQPAGQSQSHPAPETEHLDDRTRSLLFSIIDMLDDLVNVGVCLKKLKVEYIAILSNGRPKLVGAKFEERTSMTLKEFKDKVVKNYNELAFVISRDILATLPKPSDITHLLYLMENHALAMCRLINYHSATVPLENYMTLYTRTHNYVWDILRIKDPRGFKYVMLNLEYDLLWRLDIPHNRHLLQYYKTSSYENNEPQGSKAHTLKEARQVSWLNRNGASHPLENALDLSAPDGMAYSQCTGLGHIYRAHFPRLTYSLQTGLEAIDRLKLVEIRGLFSNSS